MKGYIINQSITSGTEWFPVIFPENICGVEGCSSKDPPEMGRVEAVEYILGNPKAENLNWRQIISRSNKHIILASTMCNGSCTVLSSPSGEDRR